MAPIVALVLQLLPPVTSMKLLARLGPYSRCSSWPPAVRSGRLKDWYRQTGVDPAQYSEAELQAQAEAITRTSSNNFDLHKFDWVLNDDQLYRLRVCESTDNYEAVSPGGAYCGAYQFSQGTWNWIAGTHFLSHVGDPRWAPPEVQDAMARPLWSMQGPRPGRSAATAPEVLGLKPYGPSTGHAERSMGRHGGTYVGPRLDRR